MLRGIDCKLFRNSAALGAGYATPTFNEVASVKDLDYKLTEESYDVTTRREKGIKVYEPTLTDLEVTFMLRIPDNVLFGVTTGVTTGDPDFDDFRAYETAYNTKVVIDNLLLTGGTTTNGAEGFRGFFKVHDFSVSQANADALFAKVTLKPAPADSTTIATTPTAEAMRHARVTAGALTYANWGSDTFA
jgi:hypothetical protein